MTALFRLEEILSRIIFGIQKWISVMKLSGKFMYIPVLAERCMWG
nr:MAG TPA: hypothetical protein [Caudoviricetes sp.]